MERLEDRRLLSASFVRQLGPPSAPIYTSAPTRIQNVGNLNLFFADDGNYGWQLWRTDGTPDGTIPTEFAHIFSDAVSYKGHAYFFADGGLWRTDGTSDGTVRIVGDDDDLKFAGGLTVVGDYLLFTQGNSVAGTSIAARLWRTDGTKRGTVLLKEATPPTIGDKTPVASSITPIGDGTAAVFVMNNEGQLGPELWRTDGTADGTYLLKDTDPFGNGNVRIIARVGNEAFFQANTRASAAEPQTAGLWKTDGTPQGTFLVRGSVNVTTQPTAVLGGIMYFVASTGGEGYELWRSDGTRKGTYLLKDIFPGAHGGTTPLFGAVTAPLTMTGASTWLIDNTGGFGSGPNSSEPRQLTATGDLLYFTAEDGEGGRQVWRSDGTTEGTARLSNIDWSSASSQSQLINNLTAVGDMLFFTTGGPTESSWDWYGAIYKSDGTSFGTMPILQGIRMPATLASVNGSLLFTANSNGWQLFRWDETGVIAGEVFNDVNGDGVRGATELSLAGWRVFIDKDGDGAWDRGEPNTRTREDGRYQLDLLPRGTFNVRVTPLDGDWSPTFRAPRATAAVPGTTTEASLGMLDATPALGAVTGTVFDDANIDGIYGAGDAAFAGVRVFLDLNGNGFWSADEPSARSTSDGSYRIENVPEGQYVARIVQIGAGYYLTASAATGARLRIDEGAVRSAQFGMHFEPRDAVIRGTIFDDRDTDGLHDRGEAGFAGLAVYLDANGNGVLDTGELSAVTDSTGYFKFGRLPMGTYTLRPLGAPSAEWFATTDTSVVATLATSQVQTASFGYEQRGMSGINGIIFNDANGDGLRQPSESDGITGWTVYADVDRDGVRDADEPYGVSGRTGGGVYIISGLVSGTYLIRFVPTDDRWTFTHGAAAVEVFLGPAKARMLNAGAMREPASVSGNIFYDLNGNRRRTADEPGRAGVTVYLDLNHNDIYDPTTDQTTVTDESGHYRFDRVPQGTYHALPVAPAGWEVTTGIYSMTIAPTSDDVAYPDMGVTDRISVSGLLFNDIDRTRFFSTGDVRLVDYTVYADADNDGVLDANEARTQTSSVGSFLLPLAIGEHVLRFLPRSNDPSDVEPGTMKVFVSYKGLPFPITVHVLFPSWANS
jgi:ELWxxDGT repeat protein